MALSKVRIGELITLNNKKNVEDIELPFYGINRDKVFMPTVASVETVERSKYKIITKGMFVFSGMQTGRDQCIRIGQYNNDFDALISPAYTTFDVTSDKVIPEYFFMLFKSIEMDRYGAFLSDGSIRSNLDWEVFCDMELDLPPIDIQRKYVAVYNSMMSNQKAYETGLEDLKLVCDAYIENLRKVYTPERIGTYLVETREKNINNRITLTQGVDVNMQFIPAKREAEDRESNIIVYDGQFAFNKVVKCNGTKLPIALRRGEPCVISGSYEVFAISKPEELDASYLMLWLSRSETHRLCGFNAWGSTRDVFTFDDLCELKFPIPPIDIQRSIANIYEVYIKRKELNESLKNQIKDLCPILIKGSIEEARKEVI